MELSNKPVILYLNYFIWAYYKCVAQFDVCFYYHHYADPTAFLFFVKNAYETVLPIFDITLNDVGSNLLFIISWPYQCVYPEEVNFLPPSTVNTWPVILFELNYYTFHFIKKLLLSLLIMGSIIFCLNFEY